MIFSNKEDAIEYIKTLSFSKTVVIYETNKEPDLQLNKFKFSLFLTNNKVFFISQKTGFNQVSLYTWAKKGFISVEAYRQIHKYYDINNCILWNWENIKFMKANHAT